MHRRWALPSCYNRPMEDRIIELETRAAYQAKLLHDLDEVLQSFGKRLDLMEAKLKRLEEQQSRPQDDMEPHNTPPPHY